MSTHTWSSLPPLSALPSLSVAELKALLAQVDDLPSSLEAFPAEWEGWVDEQVPAEVVAEVREGMMLAVLRGRHRYADALRAFVNRAERESLPADHSQAMIRVTDRLESAFRWDLFPPAQQKALKPILEELYAVNIREGDIPERSPRWQRGLSKASSVLGQPPRTLLAGLDSSVLRERLTRELNALGDFSPSDTAIEWTRVQMGSWNNDASSYAAEASMRRDYDRRKAFLSDWLNELGPVA